MMIGSKDQTEDYRKPVMVGRRAYRKKGREGRGGGRRQSKMDGCEEMVSSDEDLSLSVTQLFV